MMKLLGLQFFTILILLISALMRGLSIGGVTSEEPTRRLKEMTHAKDGSKMVFIPAGEFLMGCTDEEIEVCEREAEVANARRWFTDEGPQHLVYLDAYYIDKYEVTNAQYRKFITETGHREPRTRRRRRPTAPDGPILGVSWHDAQAYAQWAGKRLPTEAEWEKAARGTDGRRYPWGNEFDSAKCNAYLGRSIGPRPVGSYPDGRSPYGLFDVAGNVWEWCYDWHGSDYYAQSPYDNPQGPDTGQERVLRGGAWWVRLPECETRCTYRGGNAPDERHSNYGFRLVMDAEESK